MHTMRAAEYDRYGPPEVLHVVEVPVPEVGPGEVLVRVHASSVNGGEVMGRAGRLRLVTGRRFPKRVGIDFTGEVVERSSSAMGLRVGDRVWGVLPRASELNGRIGGAAEYLAVSARKVAIAPESLSLVDAASLPAGGTTAITALQTHARLEAGERLLVRGGSGGVGSVAVQLGKAMGAQVTALAGAKNLDFVRSLGADVALDYRTTGPADLDRFDVVVDTVGTDLRAYRGLLAPRGRMVAITLDLDRVLYSVGALVSSRRHAPAHIRFFGGDPDQALLTELTRYVNTGAIRPVVHTVHPLDHIAEAHRGLEAGGVRGKHIVQVI